MDSFALRGLGYVAAEHLVKRQAHPTATASKIPKHTYAYAIYAFWAAILAIGIVHNIYSKLIGRQSAHAALSGRADPLGRNLTRWLRTKFVLAPAVDIKHRGVLKYITMPRRIEAIVIFIFYALALILTAVPSRIAGDTDAIAQPWRGVGLRAGIMAIATLPFVFLFAGRNNPFIWATGWNFQTFSIFHRHTARVATLLAITHGVCFSVRIGSGFAGVMKIRWFQYGLVTLITLPVMVLLASKAIRNRYYEFFLISHIALAILAIYAIFQHTSKSGTVSFYDPYLWPVVAIWACDRFLRLVRLVYCNVHLRHNTLSTPSTMTYDEASDLIRLEVLAPSPKTKPAPGQYYYMYQPTTWRGWENHPFSLGAWTTPNSKARQVSTDTMDTLVESDNNEKAFDKDIESGTIVQPYPSPSVDSDNELEKALTITADSPNSTTTTFNKETESPISPSTVDQSWFPHISATPMHASPTTLQQTTNTIPTSFTFWIRPYDGWTRRMRDACRKSSTSAIQTKLLIEGPYGRQVPLHTYDTVVLVCGGTGISAGVPYILDHIARASAGKTRTTNIKLIWTAKQSSFLKTICRAELAEALGRADFTASLFATDGATDSADEEARQYGIQPQRPDVGALILDIAKEAGSANMAVLSCGPVAMVAEARSAVVAAMKQTRADVDYFEDAFGW